MRTLNTKVLFAVIALTLMPFGAQAQVIADEDIDVVATVLEALTVSPINDLDFGDVIQDQHSMVNPDEAEAGSFLVMGEAGSEVDVTFSLPSELVNILDGSLTMDISFSSTSASSNTENNFSGGNTFNPEVGDTTLLSSASGELYVFIGGTIEPSPTQEPGDYEGTITLTVEYTGN